MRQQSVLVTGANGFIGRHLCRQLISDGFHVTACMRQNIPTGSMPTQCRTVVVQDINSQESLSGVLAGIDAVIHLAGRVHIMNDPAADPLSEFRQINVLGTANLAAQAARAGVRRFIYLSSIKVNGETTTHTAFRPDDPPASADPYGQSKWEAEQTLKSIAEAAGMEWVVVRPTLVYGPGVRGNFLRLLQFIGRGLPVPVPSARPVRSLVSAYNLADLLSHITTHPRAPGQVFLVKDSEDISTGELVVRIARAMETTPRILRLPDALMRRLAVLPRWKASVQRLLQPLVVDTRKTEELLDWRPSVPMHWALAETCRWYRDTLTTGRGLE